MQMTASRERERKIVPSIDRLNLYSRNTSQATVRGFTTETLSIKDESFSSRNCCIKSKQSISSTSIGTKDIESRNGDFPFFQSSGINSAESHNILDLPGFKMANKTLLPSSTPFGRPRKFFEEVELKKNYRGKNPTGSGTTRLDININPSYGQGLHHSNKAGEKTDYFQQNPSNKKSISSTSQKVKKKETRDAYFRRVYHRVIDLENKCTSDYAFNLLDCLNPIDFGRDMPFNDKSAKSKNNSNDFCSDDTTVLPTEDATDRNAFMKYAREIIRADLPPEVLIEKKVTKMESISLSHRSMGDQYGIVISKVLSDLPAIKSIDLRNNRLTDVGIGSIIDSICKHPSGNLFTLDLSENKLDQESALCLADFLRDRDCSLKELYLEDADMDDQETTIFMKAMEINKSIINLNFSKNSIGGMNEKYFSGTITGGRAIAEALNINTTLRRLNLNWNKLGVKSGEYLGNALEQNNSLEFLSISYNALADRGVQAIAHAISINKGLKIIDLSYNGFSSKSMLILCQSLEQNDSLVELKVDGNKIGIEGGRALIRSMNYWNVSRYIGLNHCSLHTHEADKGSEYFGSKDLSGTYDLKLSVPYDWAIAYELLRAVALNPSYQLKNCYLYIPMTNNSRQKKLINIQPSEYSCFVHGERRRVIDGNSQRFVDEEFQQKMNATEWRKILQKSWPVDATTGKPFILPRVGSFEAQCLFNPTSPSKLSIINSSGLEYLKTLMKRQDVEKECSLNSMSIIRLAAKDYKFYCYQVFELLTCCDSKNEDAITLLLELIPCIYNPNMITRLLNMTLDQEYYFKFIRKAGSLYSAFTDCPSGHYRLDLNRDIDRAAGLRLAEWSAWENQSMRKESEWKASSRGTSQNGRWNNFRNERYRNSPIIRGLTEVHLQKIYSEKIPGVLEFDFVSTSRPPSSVGNADERKMDLYMNELGLRRLEIESDDEDNLLRKFYSTFFSSKSVSSSLFDFSKICRKLSFNPAESRSANEMKIFLSSEYGIGTSDWSFDTLSIVYNGLKSKMLFFIHPVSKECMNILKKEKKYSSIQTSSILLSSLATVKDASKSANYSLISSVVVFSIHNQYDDRVISLTTSNFFSDLNYKDIYFLLQLPLEEDMFLTSSLMLRNKIKEKILSVLPMKNLDFNLSCIKQSVVNVSPFMGEVPTLSHIVFACYYKVYLNVSPNMYISVGDDLCWIAPEDSALGLIDLEASITSQNAFGLRLGLSSLWLLAEQLRDLIRREQEMKLPSVTDFIVAAYGRVVDLENFYLIMNEISIEMQREVSERLGWLNILHPMHIDYSFDLDLRLSDHRYVAEILTELAVSEPGPNFRFPKFSRKSDPAHHEWIPGWNLPDRWNVKTAPSYVKNPGIPTDGHLSVTYCSDVSDGCSSNKALRARLCTQYFLAGILCPKGLGLYASLN